MTAPKSDLDAPVRLCELEMGLTGPKKWSDWVLWREAWSDWGRNRVRALCWSCEGRPDCLRAALDPKAGHHEVRWRFRGETVTPVPRSDTRVLPGCYGGLMWGQRAVLLRNAEGDIDRAVELNESLVRLRRSGVPLA
jgi:hypothetical protein